MQTTVTESKSLIPRSGGEGSRREAKGSLGGMKKCVSHCGDGLASVFLSKFTDCYTVNLQLVYVSYTSVKLLKRGENY